MRKKTFLKLQAAVYTALVLFFLSLPLWAEAVDDDGILFIIIIVPVIGYMAFRTFKQIAQTGDDEPLIDPTQYALPEDATAEEGAGYYKRLILFLWLALGALTLITVWDLNDLEAGTALSVSVWAPIAFLYSHFGYWVAVLSAPLLGVVLTGSLIWRWQKQNVEWKK